MKVNKFISLNFVVTLVFLGLCFVSLPGRALALGQMTQPIVIDNAIKGETYESQMMMVNSDGKDETVNIFADGAIKDWVKFYKMDDSKNPITSILLPNGSSVNVMARFVIPGDEPNGVYSGTLDMQTIAEKTPDNTTSVAVTSKVPRDVKITVGGGQVVAAQCYLNPLAVTLATNDPFQIQIICQNTGNVSLKPQAQLKISNSAGTIVSNTIFPYPDDLDPIHAKAMQKWTIVWQTANQAAGNYSSDTTILLGDKSALQQVIKFSVGMGPQSHYLLAGVAASGIGKYANVIIGAAALAFAILVLTFIIVGKRAKSYKKIL